MFGTKEHTGLTAEEWADKAQSMKFGAIGRMPEQQLAYANYCASMAVYEKLSEVAEALKQR